MAREMKKIKQGKYSISETKDTILAIVFYIENRILCEKVEPVRGKPVDINSIIIWLKDVAMERVNDDEATETLRNIVRAIK